MSDEIQLPTRPDVTIIKDGKQVDTSAIDDYDQFMSTLFQASVAANTAKIRKYQEDKVSLGRILNLPLDITPNSQELRCPHPCQTLYVENHGPGLIFVAVNSLEGRATPIPSDRDAYFPFENHVIKLFYVWSAPGTVATATAILKY